MSLLSVVLYFAYGSNMLSQRMHTKITSSRFKSIGEVKNYNFTYADYNDVWKGSTATIVESKTDSVWGVVWEISKDQEETLDKQESTYKAVTLSIETESFGKLDCKTYVRSLDGKSTGKPSPVYKSIIVEGAKEHGLPQHYIENLEAFEDNGYKGL